MEKKTHDALSLCRMIIHDGLKNNSVKETYDYAKEQISRDFIGEEYYQWRDLAADISALIAKANH